MFSFFKSKKPSPTEYEHAIPGHDTTTTDNDGFTVIGSSNPPYQHNQYQQSGSGYGGSNFVYPNLSSGGGGGAISPLSIGSGDSSKTTNRQATPDSPSTTFHYLQGVPFKMAAELNSGDSTEVSQLQIDEILAFLTRTFEFSADYDFRLERTLVAQ